jgi:hypothetical protein
MFKTSGPAESINLIFQNLKCNRISGETALEAVENSPKNAIIIQEYALTFKKKSPKTTFI